MSPTRPTRWGVAGCSATLLEPLGVALRDSELAASVAVLADSSAWDDAGDPERWRGCCTATSWRRRASPRRELKRHTCPAAAAAGSEGIQLLRTLARAGCALLIEPPLPPGTEQLAAHGSSPVLLAAAHLWRWHPVAVTASDLVEGYGIGEVLSAEIQIGPSSGRPVSRRSARRARAHPCRRRRRRPTATARADAAHPSGRAAPGAASRYAWPCPGWTCPPTVAPSQ